MPLPSRSYNIVRYTKSTSRQINKRIMNIQTPSTNTMVFSKRSGTQGANDKEWSEMIDAKIGGIIKVPLATEPRKPKHPQYEKRQGPMLPQLGQATVDSGGKISLKPRKRSSHDPVEEQSFSPEFPEYITYSLPSAQTDCHSPVFGVGHNEFFSGKVTKAGSSVTKEGSSLLGINVGKVSPVLSFTRDVPLPDLSTEKISPVVMLKPRIQQRTRPRTSSGRTNSVKLPRSVANKTNSSITNPRELIFKTPENLKIHCGCCLGLSY